MTLIERLREGGYPTTYSAELHHEAADALVDLATRYHAALDTVQDGMVHIAELNKRIAALDKKLEDIMHHPACPCEKCNTPVQYEESR